MKRTFFVALVIITVFLVAACKDKKTVSHDKKITMIMAESNPEDSISAWKTKRLSKKQRNFLAAA